jgi:hypothetical protein
MAHTSGIKEHMEVIGADGVHVGTVDKVEGQRLKLTKKDSGQGRHEGHHHYVPIGLVADVEGDRVRLSATGANAFLLQEEEDQGSARLVTDRQNRLAPAATPERDRKLATPGASSSAKPWVGLALGVATFGVAAAAFAASKRQSEDEKFKLQLQTDESLRLISSKKVEGTSVVGRDGAKLGQIDSFMVDKYTGRVAYAVLTFGGTFEAEQLFPLPWSILTYDEAKDGYSLDLTTDDLKRAPSFKRSQAPEFDAAYRRDIGSAYDRMAI